MTTFAHALPVSGEWKAQVTAWLSEDVPSFDVGGFVVGDEEKTATVWCKQTGVLSGVPFASEVFRQCEVDVEWLFKEGVLIEVAEGEKTAVAKLKGPARNLLLSERTALNLLARASGVATKSRRLLDLARKSGYKGTIAGTRKTTPGLRLLEKYSMVVGGIDPHRYDLSSMVMLKDNHIWSTGSITNAVKSARAVAGFAMKIEVECQSETEADEAIAAGADVIMLDNFTGEGLRVAASSIKTRWAAKGITGFLLECSGGLREENISGYFCDDIDIYSTSSVHQGTGVVDFSLKIDH
ncbi:nicotinate-nucleotide diphosphorylase (carboxylating) [Sugiyamaella lignohabitans]|uniref:Nicotinate-nucleotide pyrophosphorylase [carboxylating] n=1 Tax=Sugiyamaella lignohabitans TaxID=796027 RepID=A0A167D7B8_9ASCO|nr:nicotinate-nucleotide diphosphorylase (carboxylating) [Sugiyamaella lignohabitans]ANB12571.1 nicotinate-nucleotide diphosphorylase (carboxylating) [Sugiyamaella lignohabitans]